ncbi:MAG: hypothetical protein ACOX50_03625 [Patescibacteria group bacterium]|jgi:hypothetical protein
MIAQKGVDKNVIFRVLDFDNKYEIHITGDKVYFAKYYEGKYSNICSKDFTVLNNVLYRIKIILNNNNVKVNINDEPVLDCNDTDITHGKIGLRITTGAAYPSLIWFDNVLVTELDDTDPTPTPTPHQLLPQRQYLLQLFLFLAWEEVLVLKEYF